MSSSLTSNKVSHPQARLSELSNSHTGELGVIAVDSHTRIAAMNPAAGVMLGVTTGDFIQHPLSELMERVCSHSDVERIMEAVRAALVAWQVSTFELRVMRSKMPALFVKIYVSAMRHQDNGEPAAVVTLEDITAYRQVGLSGLAHENARRYAEVLELATQLERQKEQYRLQSIHDGLTGIYNYAHFQTILADEVARARRYAHPLALLMIDIDDFKKYNDSYGHPAGNWVLRGVATILQQTSRQTDRVARYGGEEFAVILPETTGREAVAVAERLRRTVERESQLTVGFHRPITVSIGVAGYPEDADNPQGLVLQADARLYRAKARGKNCVCGSDKTAPARQ